MDYGRTNSPSDDDAKTAGRIDFGSPTIQAVCIIAAFTIWRLIGAVFVAFLAVPVAGTRAVAAAACEAGARRPMDIIRDEAGGASSLRQGVFTGNPQGSSRRS